MYGEGDRVFGDVLAKSIRNNIYYRVGDDTPRFQTAYVGNIALGFVAAVNRIRTIPSQVSGDHGNDWSGRHFDLTDDSPVTSFSGFLAPYARHVGATTSKIYAPFWLLRIVAHFCEWVCFILSPFYTLRLPISYFSVHSMSSLPQVTYQSASKHLGYKPLYKYKDILPKCLQYYGSAYKQNRKVE